MFHDFVRVFVIAGGVWDDFLEVVVDEDGDYHG